MRVARAVYAVCGGTRGMRGTSRLPSTAHSTPVLGPASVSAMVVSFSSLTALLISALCLSREMENMVCRSLSSFFFSFVNSPCARSTETT